VVFHALVMPDADGIDTVQPLMVDDPAVTVTVATYPPFHWFSEIDAEQPPGCGGVDGEPEPGLDGDDGSGPGPLAFRPMNAIAIAAWPLSGRLWPTPCNEMPSTGACTPVPPYRVRVQPDCGVSVMLGDWLRPWTFVHCLISSPKFGYCSVVSAVPCHNCIRGRAPV
jgi:hypothetical protein